jgi:hypothetical protein
MPEDKFMTIAGKPVALVEPLIIQPVIAEYVVESRRAGGMICLSFGCFVVDGGNSKPELRITARLRMPLETAADVHRMLGEMLGQTGKGGAN